MIDFDYLYKGLCGLANAHQAGTMAGHLGAAVAAGYFYGEDTAGLPEAVYRGIEGELQRVIAGEEAIWFNAKKAGVTPTELFTPFPEGDSNEAAIASIAKELEKNIGKTRQSGHNVIFASIGIRALSDHSEYATPEVIEGIRKLTAGFNNVHAGRGYFGKETGWLTGNQVTLTEKTEFPAYESIGQMAHITVAEMIATASTRKQGFGGLWHVINHAAAIVELDRFEFSDLARKGLPAHHHHIRLWRMLPDVEEELGSVEKASHDPRDPEYWDGMLKRDQARLTHRIKTMYGYSILRRFIEDPKVQTQADDAFLYLMA